MGERITRVIGIDFGTSSTVLAYRDYRSGGEAAEAPPDPDMGVRLMAWTHESRLQYHVPSIVHLGKGQASYGWEIETSGTESGADRNFKMSLESKEPAERAHALRCLDVFFGCLWQDYKKRRTVPADAESFEEICYVSFPNVFAPFTREAIMNAAAGKSASPRFPNVQQESPAEPIAALWSLLVADNEETRRIAALREPGTKLKVLVIDMGAGTTDMALVDYFVGDENSSSVLLTWPVPEKSADGVTANTFGGREVDRLLMDYLVEKSGAPVADAAERADAEWEVKRWKESTLAPALARGEAARSYPPFVKYAPNRQNVAPMDRQQFETVLAPYLPALPRLIREILEAGQAQGFLNSPEDIDLVALTGAHSQWYFVEAAVRDAIPRVRELPERILRGIHPPSETVARGLALRREPLQAHVPLSFNIWCDLLNCTMVTFSDWAEARPLLTSFLQEPVLVASKGTPLPASITVPVEGQYVRKAGKDMAMGGRILAGRDLGSAIQGPVVSLCRIKLPFLWFLRESWNAEDFQGKLVANLTLEISRTQLVTASAECRLVERGIDFPFSAKFKVIE